MNKSLLITIDIQQAKNYLIIFWALKSVRCNELTQTLNEHSHEIRTQILCLSPRILKIIFMLVNSYRNSI